MGTRVVVQKGLSEDLTMIKMVSGTLVFEVDLPCGEVAGSVQLKLTGNRSLEIMEGMHLGYLQEIRSRH